ncbi:hypothetical protein KR084_007984, partial [Drosophila pseudotakahashii]
MEVVEILKRNLRPEIRHEILNIPVQSVEGLRAQCRRRESFLEDVRKSQGYQKVVPFRKQVSELVEEMKDAEEFSEGEVNSEVCWNCRKEGHRYKQCRMKRKVFKNNDNRPYAKVMLLDRVVVGLLDTGAAINVIGGKLAEQLIRSRVPFKRVATVATSADGQKQDVVGKFQTAVKYKDETKDLEFHIIPSLLPNPKADPRPFVAVQMMEQLVKGLLDSGAAVSCLGGNLAQEFLKSSTNFKKIAANVSTADGNKQEIVGKVRLPVCYDKRT